MRGGTGGRGDGTLAAASPSSTHALDCDLHPAHPSLPPLHPVSGPAYEWRLVTRFGGPPAAPHPPQRIATTLRRPTETRLSNLRSLLSSPPLLRASLSVRRGGGRLFITHDVHVSFLTETFFADTFSFALPLKHSFFLPPFKACEKAISPQTFTNEMKENHSYVTLPGGGAPLYLGFPQTRASP